MSVRSLCLAGVWLAALAAPALAHHSFAMFDDAKTVELQGTVKEFQWTNPHSWLLVNVTDQSGKTVEWGLEMSSPARLARNGWKPKTLVPGDHVIFKAHPFRSGEPGGQFLDVKLPNGVLLSQ
jgi:hypothetical protein